MAADETPKIKKITAHARHNHCDSGRRRMNANATNGNSSSHWNPIAPLEPSTNRPLDMRISYKLQGCNGVL